MDKTILSRGDVVQIRPDMPECFFSGCLMVVTAPKPWGAQGYIPGVRMGRAEATAPLYYFRCKWADMERVGAAVWICGTSHDEEEQP